MSFRHLTLNVYFLSTNQFRKGKLLLFYTSKFLPVFPRVGIIALVLNNYQHMKHINLSMRIGLFEHA